MQNSISGRETGGSGASDVVKLPFDALSVLLKSVGVTLSDIDDVVFKWVKNIVFKTKSCLVNSPKIPLQNQQNAHITM